MKRRDKKGGKKAMNKYLTVFVVSIFIVALGVSHSSVVMSNEKNTAVEFRASKIIGMDVKDQRGKKIGEIKDVLLDPAAGRVLFAVIDPKRSLEFGNDRFICVPMSALLRYGGKDFYVVNMTRDELKRAPSFNEDHWPNPSDRTWNEMVYKYYGQTPYWTETK
jgi:sporulation protein YlmC with PRC-barrel domain